jgi:tetratricopeptide (TPR) repeat protein
MLAASLDPDLDPAVLVLRANLNAAFLEEEPAYWFLLSGRGLLAIGELDLAQAALERATVLRPDYAEAWAWWGEARQQAGLDGSYQVMQAVRLNPSSALVQALAGMYWQRQEQPERALLAFQQAAAGDPQNPACLDTPGVRSALSILDENNGEIWAKLDAGTEEYFQKVNRAKVSLDKILKNILEAARVRPLIIQSLWFRIHGAEPPVEEIEACCTRLKHLMASGGQFKALQIYTIARDPADPHVSALSDDELDRIASFVKARVSVPVEKFR